MALSLSVRFVQSFRTSHAAARIYPVLLTPLPKSSSLSRKQERYINGFSGPSPGQVGPSQSEDVEELDKSRVPPSESQWKPTLFKMFESAATTFASILVLA